MSLYYFSKVFKNQQPCLSLFWQAKGGITIYICNELREEMTEFLKQATNKMFLNLYVL